MMVAAGVLASFPFLPARLAPAALAAPATEAAPAVPAKPAAAKRAAKVRAHGAKPADGKVANDKPADGKAGSAPPPWMVVDPDRATRSDGTVAGHGTVASHRPVEPIEIGGKWNGSNASSAQTRAENYNGDAAGTGGAVGLNLHF